MIPDTSHIKSRQRSSAAARLRGILWLAAALLGLLLAGCVAVTPAATTPQPPATATLVPATLVPASPVSTPSLLATPVALATPTPFVIGAIDGAIYDEEPLPELDEPYMVAIVENQVVLNRDPQTLAPIVPAPGESIFLDPRNPLILGNDVNGLPVAQYAVASHAEAIRDLGFSQQVVYFATDRFDTGAHRADYRFANYADNAGAVTFGTCIVTIPDTHQFGELEVPPAIFGYEFWADPQKHVLLSTIQPQTPAEFYAALNAQMAATRQAFVFIHGYNTSFRDAARRTAQIAYDIRWQGAAILYSWPSRDERLLYHEDELTIQASTAQIRQFLADVVALTNADMVHVVAHSMGNRGLAWALVDLTSELSDAQLTKLNQIVLAAPDLSAVEFMRDIVPKIAQNGDAVGAQTTIYASDTDLAITASEWIHLESSLGSSGHNLVIVPGIATVDATGLAVGFASHRYPFTSKALDDLRDLFLEQLTPEQRPRLQPMTAAAGTYWRFVLPE